MLYRKGITINEGMSKAIEAIDSGKNVFITGKAGSGKTTLLRTIHSTRKEECIIVAPTGVAAINAGGVTMHSMFGLSIGFLDPTVEKFEKKLPTNKKNVLKYSKLLIIDEISMVRCDVMDAIDRRLRRVRRCKEPFGGIQVVMFGDMMQLPPVITREEEDALYSYYDGPYFFNAQVFRKASFECVELDEVFRQRDEKFVSFLNGIRDGKLTECSDECISKMMNNKEIDRDKAVHLCAIRSVADNYNRKKLGEPTHLFKATLTGDFNEKNATCDIELSLREGARVMITKNDTECGDYFNGTLGSVLSIGDTAIIVHTDEGKFVSITPNTWECYKYDVSYKLDEEGEMVPVVTRRSTGTCTQFPLTLAYAITIHKSQGLTFDNVSLHIREIFQTGQLYTALSRGRTMEGTSIDAPITERMIEPDTAIQGFMKCVMENGGVFGKIEQRKEK